MTQLKPADAVPGSWVDQLPSGLQPYCRLARFDSMTGAWLLYWPCAWGTLLPRRHDAQTVTVLAILFFGAIVMRGAGCAYNDIIDRDIDVKVARTRGRPLPSGQLKLKQAWLFTGLLCFIGLGVLLMLPRFAQLIALGSIPLVAAYPFMKRITWWPQLWLGLTFNWGVLVGYAALAGHLGLPAYLLYGAGIFWTLGYDTIYALQDIEDDALAGVKSSARAAGKHAVAVIALFYVAMFTLCSLAILKAYHAGSNHPLNIVILLPAIIYVLVKAHLMKSITTARALRLFRSNTVLGLLIAMGFAAHAISS